MRPSRRHQRGSASVGVLSFAILWFGVFGVFLMNVQLGRHFVRRDVVDHATAVAADAASKIVCADPSAYGSSPRGELGGARAAATRRTIEPLLAMVAPSADACALAIRESAGQDPSPGMRPIEVELSCTFPCEIPFAAGSICRGTPPRVVFTARQSAMAAGCDVRDGS